MTRQWHDYNVHVRRLICIFIVYMLNNLPFTFCDMLTLCLTEVTASAVLLTLRSTLKKSLKVTAFIPKY